MGAIIVVYSVFFVFLISSAVWFLCRCVITDTLKNLRGLSVQAQSGEAGSSVSLKNNFAEFYLGVPKTLQKNFPLLVLKQICADIEDGKNYNAAWYLSLYKKQHNRFLERLFIASFAAPLLAFFAASVAGDSEYIAMPLIAFQSVLFLSAGVLRSILARNFDSFTEILYKQWHGVLFNFDAGRAHEHTELQNICSGQIEALSKAVAELASSLQNLTDEKQKGEIVTIETVINSLDVNFKRVEGLCAYLEAAAKTLELSYKELIDFTGANKPTIQAINKLAGEFAELQKTLAGHASASETAAIEKLGSVSAALESNVNKTFTTIDETIKRNAEDLFESYKRFFDLCKTLHLTRTEGELF